MRVGLFISLTLGMLWVCALAGADEIIVEFVAGDYTITDVENGEVIHLDDASTATSPGSPMLPHKAYNVALPPDVVWDSLVISIVETTESSVPGVYDVAPAPPLGRLDGSGEFEWGAATNIVDGKDMDVYDQDAFLPANWVEVARTCQMRKWKFVQVRFTPFRYNPVQRQLLFCGEVSVRIEFSRDPDLLDEGSLWDTVLDSKAAGMFINYHAARTWYAPGGHRPLDDKTFDYVIITSEEIYACSSKLADLKAHLEGNLGHTVLIVTESHSHGDEDVAGGYGAKTGQAPNGTADKIRKWLQDNYYAPPNGYGIEYVLLIGDPRTSGDVPMKTCYPGTTDSSGNQYSVPTDYYYADLEGGDWDTDDDERYGENGQDDPDFYAEVYVARIPVYGVAYTTLDKIIQKEIDYDTASGDLNWRLNVLFPLSFPWSTLDPSHLANCMKTEYLDGRGFSYYEMYQEKHSTCTSDYPPDEVLTGGSGAGTLYNRWTQHVYGMVWLFGHGWSDGCNVGCGTRHGCDASCSEGRLFQSSWCSALDDKHPAFTFQISCSNGKPSSTTNLGYSLLKNGAICTCSASAVAYGTEYSYDYSGYSGDCHRNYGSSQDIGYYYGEKLSKYDATDDSCLNARAFYDANAYLSGYDSDRYAYHGYFVFNLYGCPHTRLFNSDTNTYIRLDSFEARARGRNIVLTWETGAEIDNAGFIIYRYDGDTREPISGLIEPKGSPTAGASYRFVDSKVRPGVTYQYWLVDIDTDGTWTAHGPVRSRISLEPTGVRIRKTIRDRISNEVAIAR